MLLPFFEWMNRTAVAKVLTESIWIFPLVQAIHLVFLALLAGSILIVDLRLLGWGMREQPIRQVANDARRWFLVGFFGMVATGLPQLIQNASREYYSEFFWYKMYLIATGLIFTFTIRHWAARSVEPTILTRVVGILSIAIWTGVAVNGRLIGLFS